MNARARLAATEVKATAGQVEQAACLAPKEIELRGAVLDLTTCTDSEILIEGPFGTGKTVGILAHIYRLLDEWPGCRILIVRKTRESLADSALVTWENFVVPAEHPMLTGTKRNSRRLYKHTNGSELVVGGLNNSKAIEKVKSAEYDFIYVVEATEITEEDYEILIGRLRNGVVKTCQQIVLDANPGHPQHWINQRALRGELTRLRSRHEDNPRYHDGENWTKEGREYLDRLNRMRGVRYKRNALGLWAANEGTVYETYDPDVHESDRFPEHCPYSWERIWVTDFGYSNAFVWQQWAIDPDGRMWLEFEIYHTRKLLGEHAAMIRDATALTPPPTIWLCDHDAQDRAELEALLGMTTMPAYKAIRVGIDACLNRLNVLPDGRPRLYVREAARVHPPDPYLIEKGLPLCTADEFGYYAYPEGTNKRDEPIDAHNHGMDCMRYGVAHQDKLGVENRTPSTQGGVIRRRRVTYR